MAQEADYVPEVGDEDAAALETGQLNEGDNRPQTSSEVAELARGLGWVPEDEWDGPAGKWSPPEVFIRQKVNKGDRLYDELREVKETTTRLARTSAAITEREIARARSELEEQFRAAVEAGDIRAANQARQDLTRVETEAATAGEDPEVASFVERNASWFNLNEEATAYARSVAQLQANKGASPATQIKAAEDAVKKRFPELFDAADQREPRKAPTLNAPNTRAARSAPKEKGVAELPTDALAAGRDFVKRGRVKSLEDYAKMYWQEEGQ